MTSQQLKHLRLIDAHLAKLLAVAEKRMPGKWFWHWRDGDNTAPGSIFATPREGHTYAVAMCPRYGKDHFSDDATFIASCAGNAEAGWRATRAAIQNGIAALKELGVLQPGYSAPVTNAVECITRQLEAILAAFPLELVKEE